MPNIGGIIRKWTVTFSGLNLQSKDNDSFFKMIFVTSRNAKYPQKEKKCLQVLNTGSMAGSDHRFCILEIKKLMTQVKKKLYQNTHKVLEIQYSVCQLTSFASSASVHSESRLYTDLCSSSCKIQCLSKFLPSVLQSLLTCGSKH